MSTIALRDLTEKQWDAQLFNTQKGLATTLGWRLVYHTLRSKGSNPGFPDRVLVHDRLILAELKREGEKPTGRQREWLTGLARAGAEVYLWRPSDLEEIGRVLSGRWKFTTCRSRMPDAGGYLERNAEPPWRPRSLWLPAGCRTDQQEEHAA